MKRHYLLLLILALVASCAKKTPDIESGNLILEVKAPLTKIHLDGLKLKWDDTDKIVVNNNVSTSITVLHGGTSARFEVPATSPPLYIFYPSTFNNKSFSFPAVQSYVAGSPDPAATVMTAYSASLTSSVQFQHAVAYLKLTISGSHSHDIKSIEVASIAGEDLSGTLTYDSNTGLLTGETSARLKTKLYCAAGMPQGQALYMAIPAKTYTGGLKLRIVDVKNHYQDIQSTKTFTAVAGTVYNTEVEFSPTGTVIDSDIADLVKEACKITPYFKLNSYGHSPSSHAGESGRSTLTPIGGTYQTLDKTVTGTDMPIFPSFVKSGEGYIMFYHKGYKGEVESWSGVRGAWAASPDGINWTYKGELFPIRENVAGHYGNTIRVFYSGPYGVRLANGNILAAAAYRGSDDFRHNVKDNGISIKISSNEGATWSEEKLINVGTCWEPHVLVLDEYSSYPGRVIIYYTDSCPYIEDIVNGEVKSYEISTGVSYIYSDDNGNTWMPDDPLNNHLFAYRRLRGQKNASGSVYNVYTNQMPAVIQLSGRKQLVGCGESQYIPIGTSGNDYWIDVAYSDANGDWGTPDANGVMPAIRTDKLWAGSGSSLIQFTSGESYIAYSDNNVFYMRSGNENALNWSNAAIVFNRSDPIYASNGFWGRLHCSNHVMIAGVGGAGGADGKDYTLQVGQFYLNHNITASIHSVTVDGDNGEWPDSGEALFVGSNGNMHATARFSVKNNVLYILAEIENSSLSDSDYFRLYFSNPSASNVAAEDKYIQIMPQGDLSQKNLSTSSIWEDAALGATANVTKGSDFYFAEISVPLASLPVNGSALLVNLSANDSLDGVQSILPMGTNVSTTSWPKINY